MGTYTTDSRAMMIRRALLGATILAGAFPIIAQAQDAQSAAPAATTAAPDQNASDDAQAIIVTGYRRSLAEAIASKRDTTSFSDSIFAEDIGKFPDTNIAESLNRIPGVTISRDIDGSGTNVAIRGLGSNFTSVTLNGAPIAVASSGTTDAQGTDRSVDLSFFPTELFTQLTVNKSYSASLIEGGAAGNVNLRSARPFDREGTHFSYSLQGIKNSPANKWGGRGSALASATFGDFGILAGVSAQRDQSLVKGFETIGWTNPNLSAAQCGATSGCNSTGGGNWTIPGTVPANAGNGLVTGTTIDQAFLLAHNPGLTIQQIDNGIIPRLGRPSISSGTRDRINAILSAEWKPSDKIDVYIDGMYGRKKNDLRRIDMNWVGRNGSAIPLNMTVDKDDCSNGCTVTSGTFANSQFFLEYRPFIETTEYYGFNPGLSWQVMDNLKFNFQVNYLHSTFHRESPTVLVNTAASSGVTVDYVNNGSIPSITTNVDLNDPANFIWNGGRVNVQDERRTNINKGLRGDLTWGDESFNIKAGGNYDDISRRITAYDNSQAWQNATCGNDPSVFVPSPNSQPACQGLDAPGSAPAGYPTWPGYTGGAVTYGGSLIPQSALASYLVPGPGGFVTLDWKRFAKDSNYAYFHDNAPDTGSANTGASGGYIREKSAAGFIEANGKAEVAGSDLRYNIGVRFVHTDQTISGRVSLPDPRNTPPAGTPAPLDGGLYPNIVSQATTHNSYDNWLPAMNLAYDVGEHAVARLSLSKTMTRPDPNAQLPGVNFSSPSADVATIGNPALKPYVSKNIDLGIEYYTGPGGLVSMAAFRKEMSGFTTLGTATVNFSSLAPYGITYDNLNPTQQGAINARGGPDNATVVVQQQVNASGKMIVNGLEFQWVQPLDFVTEQFGIRGLGFNANATIVDQHGEGTPAPVAYGVAKYTYNITGYYENHGVSLRVSTTFQKGSQISGPNQNGITNAALFSDDLQRWDFSSSFDLYKMFGIEHAPEITFDVANFGNATQRTYFQFTNATYTAYKPGRQFMIGVRGSF
ncbi:TonB-dependent receptor [Novosphingobium sp. PhB165]|uniref:TonB-dependent receptor n=1 Tax=Novosphingobium sp. PhB165 TaxID=2485105 RepID=UPI0010ED5126|nr:TonB-dependent receptor [Novosphingobium sp. PhB165]TCM20555.1 TonB-dependent receptor [Novosphingobium sp. PhB165]